MATDIKYVADLAHVREVALVGVADLPFWSARLAAEGLRPALLEDRAAVLLTAMQGVFKGIRFREVSVSVLLDDPSRPTEPGAFLVHAFNSNRFFACCERVFFHTPYVAARIDVQLEPIARVEVQTPGGGSLNLEMRPPASDVRRADSVGPGGWQGPVHLPSRTRGGQVRRRWFQAVIQGETQTFAARPDDRCEFVAGSDGHVMRDLLESQFVPRQWQLRSAARHAKSKTYHRDAALAAAALT